MFFSVARPVWFPGREREANLFAGFRAVIESEDTSEYLIRYTCASLCRVFVNGKFVAHGPARGPHGFFRVDELRIAVDKGVNVIAFEVAAYNLQTYYTLDVPAFFQAEVTDAVSGKILAATFASGDGAFAGRVLEYRVRKVPKFSLQRPFMEVWRLSSHSRDWRGDANAAFAGESLAEVASGKLLPRGAPYPGYAEIPASLVGAGAAVPPPADFCYDGGEEHWWLSMSFAQAKLPFALDELEIGGLSYVAGAKFVRDDSLADTPAICKDTYRIFDFGKNASGFISAQIEVTERTRLIFVFDELMADGDVPLHRLGCNNVADIELDEAGSYRFAFFDPVTCRYVKAVVISGGAVSLSDVKMIEYANPEADRATFRSSDPALDRIFEAARETLRQNAVDVFTDCPSRERAGWLCDSYFIGRSAFDYCGNTEMEKTFIENFAISESFGDLPRGVFPMCYPADHANNNFIPNWAMWLVIELEEYVARSGDTALAERIKPRVMDFIRFLEQYENADGLLEKLPAWVFVEWSRANDLVQDVNYPTNMTYAAVLRVAARLYGDAALLEKADRVVKVIREQSYDGLFFRDHAIRHEDGTLVVDPERTEVCQYYAFFFGTATAELYPELWTVLRDAFGPFRHETGAYPDVGFANAFIGNYLRLELLSRAGLSAQILKESKGYFLKMADLTGTLWELDAPTASCCHGFASHAGSLCLRDVLGIRAVDVAKKTVTVAVPRDLPLDFCEGSREVPGGRISVKWRKAADGDIAVQVDLPEGWETRHIR